MFWLHFFFFFKQKTAYEMRISDWSSDVCSSDLFTKTGTEIGAAAPLFTEGVAGRGLHLVRSSRTHCGDVRQRRRPCNVAGDPAPAGQRRCGIVEIGRASCRERVCQYV